MRNKAQNATLEQRSTPLINGTEITLGAFFVALWKREWKGGEGEVIKKAKEVCVNSQYKVQDHFEDMHEMVEIGKGVKPLKSLAERCPKTCLWLIA